MVTKGGSMVEKHTDAGQEQKEGVTPTPTQPATPGTNGLAIAAMVVGIVALLGGLLPFWGFVLGAVAVILGIIALKKPLMKGMSITGIVTGGLAVLWSVFVTIAFIALLITGAAVGTSVASELDRADAETQSLIDAKKDFGVGETANFADKFEIKINSVQRNYVPESSFYKPAEGNEFVLLNVSVKNISDETEYVSDSQFSVNEAGVAVTSSFITVDPDLGYGDLSPDATKTGNVVYEVTKDATGLKLQYSIPVYSIEDGSKKLVYTLAF